MTSFNATPTLDRDTVQRLVAEVIRRIQAEARPAAPKAASPAPAAPTSAGSSSGAPEAKSHGLAVADKVITLALLERLPVGTKHVVIEAKAVVTPLARDYAKEAAITIVRGGGSPADASAAPPRPFLIAHAQCKADPAAKAAAIARAVPAAQHLPPSGLADVITTLATHASRDAARGILLTSRPSVATILANRSASLRAVTGRDATQLVAVAADCQANLLIVDPAAFAGGLERLCADFATRPAGPLPSELTSTPAGCGCKTHSH
jgi:hypothetical protein